MAEAGGGDQIGWTTDAGVVTVTSKEKINSTSITRIYDIRDLLLDVPDFTDAPSFSLESRSTRGGGGGPWGWRRRCGGGGGGQGLFGGSSQQQDREQDEGKTREEMPRRSSLIMRRQPRHLGRQRRHREDPRFNGSIVVRAPECVHEAIGGAWD